MKTFLRTFDSSTNVSLSKIECVGQLSFFSKEFLCWQKSYKFWKQKPKSISKKTQSLHVLRNLAASVSFCG